MSGLYDPRFEHDSCGFGLIAQLDDHASNDLVFRALDALGRLSHRGGVGADGATGDGCGLLLRRPERFLLRPPCLRQRRGRAQSRRILLFRQLPQRLPVP